MASDRLEKHKAKMKRKAVERRERVPGFTPVRNRRVEGALEAARLLFAANGFRGVELESRAQSHVANQLPPPRKAFNWLKRPTKNADPAYRKSIWPAAKIERRKQSA